MKREQAKKERRDFYDALATELESHLANGSGFIYQEPHGEDASDEVVKLRESILESVVRQLRSRGAR